MKSTIEASVNQRTVWVKVEPIDDKLTKVTVQARTKLGGGDVALASEIDKQIAIRRKCKIKRVARAFGKNVPSAA